MNCFSLNDVSVKEIVDLYCKGWSINDIVTNYNLSVVQVRSVLQEKGFDTKAYRKISTTLRSNIVRCVSLGISYRNTAPFLDVSPYLVRQVMDDCDKKVKVNKKITPVALNSERLSVVRNMYFSAEQGFSKVIEQLNLSDVELFSFFCSLTNEEKLLHQKNLKNNILNLYDQGLPVGAISKKMDISVSVVKKCLNEA